MSCPSEITASTWVDGELPSDEARSFEAHLIGCQGCRARVLALRDEMELLHDVLRDRPRAAPEAVSTVPEPGLTLGFPAAVLAVASALAVGSFLLESRMPGGLDLLNPLHLKGVTEMMFDLVFLLRERGGGLVELVVSLGIVAAVSALLSFVVSLAYRRIAGPAGLALLCACLLGVPTDSASALELRFDDDTEVRAGETLSETLIASGDRVVVDGVIDGDLVVAAERVDVRGTVNGSVYAFAREVDVSGTVTGSVIAISERVRVDGDVHGRVYAGVERFTLGAQGRLRQDLAVFSDVVELDGAVGRDVVFLGDSLEVRASVGRNLEARRAKRVALLEGARIGGDVEAHLPHGTEVDMAPGARVAGELRVEPLKRLHRRYLEHYLHWRFYAILMVEFAAGLVFGLLLYRLVPRLFDVRLATTSACFRALGEGFLLALAAPIAIVLVGLTLVGLPVATSALFLFLTSLYAADLVVAVLIGRAIVRVEDAGLPAFARALGAGLAVVLVAQAVPFLGPPVAIVMLLVGLGLIVGRARALRPALLASRG